MRKQDRYYSEEQKEIRNFIKILIGLVLIIGIFYFLTVYVTNKKEVIKRTNTAGKINYDSIMLGTLLNRAEEEYYVFVFDSNDVNNTYLINKVASYKAKENSTTLYTSDISLELNKAFKSNATHYSKDSVEDLKISKTTLIKVSNGKIVKFIDDYDSIINELD